MEKFWQHLKKENNMEEKTTKTKLTYDKALDELNTIVTKLDSGAVPMAEASKLFDRGLELTKFCYKQLDTVKGKLTEIHEELGKLTEE